MMKCNFAFVLSILSFLCFPPRSCAEHKTQPPVERHDTVIEGSIKNDVYVVQDHTNGKRREIIVIRVEGHTYHVPDERVAYVEDGHRYFYNDDDDSYGHDLELSPDKRWLFVGRKCMHTVSVGYLYHRDNNQGFVPVYPDGLRFDAAAIDFFARTYGTPQPLLSQGTWIIGLNHWDRDGKGMTFDLTVGEHLPKMIKGTNIEAHYNFQKRLFQLIKKKNYFDTIDT